MIDRSEKIRIVTPSKIKVYFCLESTKWMKNNLKYLNALLTEDSTEILNIYKENFSSVQNFVIQNNGRTEDAEDVFQKALVQIAVRYRKEKFEIKSSFEAYLFTACKNLWRRELNKLKRGVTSLNEMEHKDEERDQALALLEQKRWELFMDNVSLMTESCQKVLKLFFAKVPYRKIVEQLQYSSETVVRQRVFRCKQKLTEMIKRDHRFNYLQNL